MDDDTPFSPPLAESTGENVPKTIVIAPEGDAVLVVGPEKARLRVSTGSLGAASKVFKAMFSTTWAEGQNLSSTAPKDIELPENSPTATEAICCVLHFRNDIVPSLNPEETLQVAITADKYDVVLALRYATTAWLNRPQPRKKMIWLDSHHRDKMMINDGYLLAAAYILQDVESFARISHDLICHYSGSYSDLYRNEAIRDALHPMTIYCLEDRRTRLRTEIQEVWGDGINEPCTGYPIQYPQSDVEWEFEEWKLEVATCSWRHKRMEKYKALRERYQNGVALYSTPISQLVWESEEPMADHKMDMETMAHHSAWAEGCCDWCREYENCMRCRKEHSLKSHTKIHYEDTFHAKWERLKRRHCLCFNCLEGTPRNHCPFHHENSELDAFTPAQAWDPDFRPAITGDGWW